MRRLALTLGDPNGIGPEICLKALHLAPELAGNVTVYGSRLVLERTAHALGLDHLLSALKVEAAGELAADAFQPGVVDARAGASTVQAATAALQACQAGEVDAVVAGPHHETAIHRAGIAFSGYPSLVARACGMPEDAVFLLLVGGGLRIVHVTLHEGIRHALARLTPQLVVDAAKAGVRGCALLGVDRPTIGVFGINPHASEGGLWGDEDAAIVGPAVAQLRSAGLQVDGPQGADTLLAARAHDLYVAMVHDQGHIPVKLLAPQQASALSVGANVVLSSVGHGSAMDIAGRGIARPDALLRTLRLLAGSDSPTEDSPTEQTNGTRHTHASRDSGPRATWS
jgi:1,2-dihydroxy-3,5-cyclohexadiene-1,4-dicarboxylate dehydrogenase